jgi:hypothetical protein
MSRGREVRSFDYVNHPYDEVRSALTGNTLEVFQSATRAATTRAHNVASQLHVDIAGIELGTDISIEVKGVREEPAHGKKAASTIIELEWEAAKSPRLFPFMRAELAVYALTSTETQLDFYGRYEPPLGPLGSAMNAVAGHTIAEASVHRFVRDVAEYLRRELE